MHFVHFQLTFFATDGDIEDGNGVSAGQLIATPAAEGPNCSNVVSAVRAPNAMLGPSMLGEDLSFPVTLSSKVSMCCMAGSSNTFGQLFAMGATLHCFDCCTLVGDCCLRCLG